MKMTYLFRITCLLLLFSQMRYSLAANTIQTFCNPTYFSADFGGGFIVVIQGLLDDPTTFDVPLLKSGGEQNLEIKAIVLGYNGIAYSMTTEDLILDFSNVQLLPGDYILIMEIGSSIQTLDFSID